MGHTLKEQSALLGIKSEIERGQTLQCILISSVNVRFSVGHKIVNEE